MSSNIKTIENLTIGALVRYRLVELDKDGQPAAGVAQREVGDWSEARFQGRGANTALFTEGEAHEEFDWIANLTDFGWVVNDDGFATWRVEMW